MIDYRSKIERKQAAKDHSWQFARKVRSQGQVKGPSQICEKSRNVSRNLGSKLNVGALNMRGLSNDLKKIQLANDMHKCKLPTLAIQETKMKKKENLK